MPWAILDKPIRDQVFIGFPAKTKLAPEESPTNPFLRISDIAELAGTVQSRRALLAVDNTMLSPCLQNPLLHGADIVVHSATKFLCGHSDVTAGAVVTNSPDLHEQISFVQNAEGSGLIPFDSWLLLRGLKTLALRVERQTESARMVAQHLSSRPGLTNVYYPGIGLRKGDSTHAKQASGGGSVISFTTGNADVSKRIVESTELCSIAVSFGSVHSTISMPCYMWHVSIPEALRDRLAPPHDLIRLSVGIEDVDDIVDDPDHAIEAAFGRLPPGIRA